MTLYACPICQSPLKVNNNSLRCDQNHSFDFHKKGYINLLLSQYKSSKNPGDNAQMVKARSDFLRAGHYQAFADAILSVLSHCQPSDHFSILDSGCGEGFYTQQIQQSLENSRVYGLDISKPAIHAAATNKEVHWCVASSSRLPYVKEAFDVIVSIFSRVEANSFLQHLKPNGYVLYAGPGDNHLHALRRIIYDNVNDYSTEKHQSYFSESFTLVHEQAIQVPIHLKDNTSIMQLVSMTPHAHRIPYSGRLRLQDTHSLQDTGDFKIYLYQKTSL